MKRIAVILTVFNRREKTVSCLKHLIEAAEAAAVDFSVFLSDDGCTDGTAEAVQAIFGNMESIDGNLESSFCGDLQSVEGDLQSPLLHIVQGDGTLYWAGGMRKAWQAAIDSGTPWDYYLLINDDTYLYNNVFPQLFEAIEYGYSQTGRYGMASGITCQPGRPEEITYGGLNFVNKTKGRQELVKPSGTPQRIDMTHANILLVHHTVVEEIGIFHKGFRHSCADNDYSMTAARHGLPVYSTSKVCGECERDHSSLKEQTQQLMRMSLAERKKYVNAPLHCDSDYLLLVRRNMPLRYPMARLIRAIRLYLPKVYYHITNFRGVYKMVNGQRSMVKGLLLLLSSLSAEAAPFVFTIDSQEKFAQMNAVLTKAIAEGETDIVLDITKGVYYFRENHMLRRSDRCPDVSVTIQGHDAVLIADGNDFSNSHPSPLNPNAAFVDTSSLTAFDFWDDCRYAVGLVEVVDKEAKLCRLPVSPQTFSSPLLRGGVGGGVLYINIPQWFYSSTYKVEKAGEGYLYFTVPNLKYVERKERSGYNVNYDYLIGEQNIRFRLWNPSQWGSSELPSHREGAGVGALHECRVTCFLNCDKSCYKTFALSGLHFLGNSNGNFLIKLDSVVTDSFSISDCRFEAIKSYVLWANRSPSVSFSQNRVEHCNNVVLSSNSCAETRVVGNTFRDCGENMMQTFCVNCKGKDYYIAHNEFCNYGYAAVGLGVPLSQEKVLESSGIVEYNEIWCDSDYIAHKERYTLQDTGAIYFWPQNDSVTARYNYIHDIDGMRLNRGIFCDDGASHFSVYGNVVMNVANSYSIESRNCENKLPGANTDIRIEGNFVDSPIKFEGSSKGDNHCVVSGNVLFYKEGEEPPVNVYSRLTTESPDRQMPFYGHDPDGIIVSRQQMEQLRELPHYNNAIKAAKWRYK